LLGLLVHLLSPCGGLPITCGLKRGRSTKTNFGNAIHYLQRVLDDSLNRANKVAKRGSIKDDRFLTKFKKDMIIKVAEEYRSEVHDLHASLSTQIPRS
jgi:hypothetical protein